MAYLRWSTAFAKVAGTTAYGAADLIANHATAGSVVVPHVDLARVATGIKILGGYLRKSGDGVTNADFNVHLFSSRTAPIPTVGDNGVLLATQVMATTGQAAYRGWLTGAKANIRVFSDGALCPLTVGVLPYLLINADPDGLRIHFLIEAVAAYVPITLETFSLGLIYEPIVDDPTV